MSLSHCSAEQLLDIVDGVVDAAAVPHLAACAACRQQLDDLREALASARSVDVPEPSPLFWNHLSSRVREAIAGEMKSPPTPWRVPAWAAGRLRLALPGLAALAVLIVAVVAWPARQVPPRDEAPSHATAASVARVPAQPAAPSEPQQEDASIGLMLELAGTVDLDSAADAGLMTSAGAADAAVLDLSAAEQVELQRLLKEAMGVPGA